MRRKRPQRPVDDHIWRATRLFIDGRLQEPSVLTWAAGLEPQAAAERKAVRDAVFSRAETLSEPYITGWRCVLESWRDGTAEDPDMSVLEIKDAIGRGADPRIYLDAIVRLAAPRLRVRPRNPLSPVLRGAPHKVGHLLAVDLEPDHHVRLEEVGLASCPDPRVWEELLDRAEGQLFAALHLAERLELTWSANWIARVYPKTDEGDSDPDEFRSTLVPVVRLVSAALARLGEVDPATASKRLSGLAARPWPLARRLWAAAARDAKLVGPVEIMAWLESLTDEELWNTHQYPELAELRAQRHCELDQTAREALERRVRKGPPTRLFRRGLPKTRRDERRRGDILAELIRLRSGACDLTEMSRAWLKQNAELDPRGAAADLYDTGAGVVPSSDRHRLDLDGADSIAELEQRLTDDPYGAGRGVLEAIGEHWDEVYDRLDGSPSLLAHGRVVGALAFTLRDRLGVNDEDNPEPDKRRRVSSLVDLLGQVPASARTAAASGVAYWFDQGRERFPDDPRFPALWLAYWPYAAAATNLKRLAESDGPFDREPEAEKLASEAANSPVGRMMYAYFHFFPRGEAALRAFDDPILATARDAILSTKGEAYRHSLYRMLLQLPFLSRAAPGWTRERLLRPLAQQDGVDPQIWDAISRIGLLPNPVLATIAEEMVRRISDVRLASGVRARLAERLVLPVAIALKEGVKPPVTLATIEQLLRLGGEEVRASSARALTRFIADSGTPEEAFRKCVLPILERGWPKDRSAQSAGVSNSFASLPSAAEGALSDAVAALSDLLVPFDVWSLWEYRLYRREEGTRELKHPGNPKDARAILELLDRTVGDEEGAVVPHDLDVALVAILTYWPQASRDRRYGRLAALARR